MFYALFFPEKLDNFISINIFTIIDGVPSETGCYSLRTLISAGVLGLITYSAKLFISRFISSEKIRVKKINSPMNISLKLNWNLKNRFGANYIGAYL